jgi:hypothetical protein
MPGHGRAELEREGRLINANTRASLMSDTKWRKLFTALQDSALALEQYVFKFVGGGECVTIGKPWLFPPHAYFDHIDFGPTPFRSIEWFLIPRFAEYKPDKTIPIRRVPQDVEGAAKLIGTLGRYPIELSDRGLCVTGHLTA